MTSREFYDYIIDNFGLGGAASRLVHNIITYVDELGFTDQKDVHHHLTTLLGGAFGLDSQEIKLCDFS